MTDYYSMSDNELCERISTKREPKPETPPKKFSDCLDNKSWRWSPFEQDKGWRPINWLSWENAGSLLEEIAPIQIMRHPNGKYTFDVLRGIERIKIISSSFGRGICEAWLSVNS